AVGEVGAVAKNAWPHTLACDDASQTVFDVVSESRLALLTVTHHVHTSVDLLAHDLGHGATHPPRKGRVVVGLVCFLYAHHLQQVWRTCQTPGMGGENALGAALHSLPSLLRQSALGSLWTVICLLAPPPALLTSARAPGSPAPHPLPAT